MSMMDDFSKGNEPHPIMGYVAELEAKVKERDMVIKGIMENERVADWRKDITLFILGVGLGGLVVWVGMMNGLIR